MKKMLTGILGVVAGLVGFAGEAEAQQLGPIRIPQPPPVIVRPPVVLPPPPPPPAWRPTPVPYRDEERRRILRAQR